MTAAQVEASILDLVRASEKAAESIENLKDRLSESRAAHEKLDAKLEVSLARHDRKLEEISVIVALLNKDVDDLKRRADESRKNRWALFIAILSAALSLTSALVVAFVKKV